jgi:hypothetical protein
MVRIDKAPAVDLAREGIANLVANCAQVAAGEKVVLLNDPARIDKDVSDLLQEAVLHRGAQSSVIWTQPATSDQSAPRLSSAELAEIQSADKLIAHASPELLTGELAEDDRGSLLVTNRSGTLAYFGLPAARYHWGLLQLVYDLLENELFKPGTPWRITSPSGTDLKGTVGDLAVRARYFDDEVRAGRGRAFATGAYLPIASADAAGSIVVDWLDGGALKPAHDPPHLEIRANKVERIGGGLQNKQWVEEYWTATEKLVDRFGNAALEVDSWHGGVNPWSSGWTGGTRHLHYHMGRTTGQRGDFVYADNPDFTLTIDDVPVFQNGRLAILDHPKIRAVAEQDGVTDWKEPLPASSFSPIS